MGLQLTSTFPSPSSSRKPFLKDDDGRKLYLIDSIKNFIGTLYQT